MSVPIKRVSPKKLWRLMDYSPCPSCNVWLVSRLLWKHQKNCTAVILERDRIISHENISTLSYDGKIARTWVWHSGWPNGLRCFWRAQEGGDQEHPLICGLGNISMKRKIGNKALRRYSVSSAMRLASRCLMELRDLQEDKDVQKNRYHC